MPKPQRISISAAARLLGKARTTVADKAVGLESVYGNKGAKLYDACELMQAIFGQQHGHIIWEESDALDLAKAMDQMDKDDEKGTAIDI